MVISFRNADDGLTSKIFVDDSFVGIVILDVWTSRWKIKPSFKYNSYIDHEALYSKYDSSYKAGKALVSFYEEIFKNYDDALEDTQEIDIRDIWKSFKRDP